MHANIRLFLIFFFIFCGALPGLSFAAEPAQETAAAIKQAVASCRGDQQCEAAVRKRETLAAEKRQQRDAADNALKASSPGSYYLMLLGRFLKAIAFIGGAAGLYVLVMHFLFGKHKQKRRRKTQNDLPH
ncbi:hypothetical protein [Noviherbaspirillum sp. Root189]|uniref:hypothetical protein n=1 Tax=Noviherbaspirillum sp. Root189 TaxID=1736487 RepID=UPI00070FCDD4|nr:hypothetical protein [Noviherbaspirillum sp. Root189]KRB93991.1 hypothetical protein ASE07_00095 [Noviherbaspirillum sp. Root189]